MASVAVLLLTIGLVPASAAVDDPGRGDQWALDRIGAAEVVSDGDGVVVAVIDSGIDMVHVDLRDRLVAGTDFVEDDDDAQDRNGHGTHVAGIVGATAGNGAGIEGVAAAARLMPVRVLDANGEGNAGDVVEGIRWAIGHGADVINLSLGEATQALLGPSFGEALREAWAAGVVPVVAAGNERLLGSSGFTDEPALVVAATTRDDTKPSYSSVVGGAEWGMAAPGGDDPASGPVSAVLSTFWVDGKADQYAYDAGTSMAAAHVSGAVAVLLGLGLSPQEAVDRLLATAVDVGPAGRDTTFGSGRLDLAAAADGIDPGNEAPAPEPSPPPTAATTTTVAPAAPTTSSTDAPQGTTTSQPAPSTTAPDDETNATSAANASDADDDDPDQAVPAALAALLALGAGVGAFAVRRRTP